MEAIKSIEELIEKLDHSDISNQGEILKNTNIPLSDFEAYASWDKNTYTRNCIYRTDEYEMILLCWKKGDETPIHGHDDQNCWVYQLEGKLTEIRYEKTESGNLTETNRLQLLPGKLTFMNAAMGYHKLNNDNDLRAMTLHVYVSPIISCEVFNDSTSAFEVKEMKYDTLNGQAFTGAHQMV